MREINGAANNRARTMRRCVSAILLACAVSAIWGILVGSSEAEAVIGAQTPMLGPGDQRLPEGYADLVLAARASVLARALDSESKSKKYGTFTSVSFPLATCAFAGGLCGAINRDASIVVPPQFDWVGDFHEGRALVRSGGLYGYVDLTGRLVVEPQFVLAGDYWHGFAEVDIGGKSALINFEGRRVLEPKFARALPFSADAFWVKDGTRRPFNQDGFDQLVTNYGTALNTHAVADGNWILIDRNGIPIPTPRISSIKYFDPSDDKLMWAHTDAGWGLIKSDGLWLVPPKYEQVGEFAGGRVAVRLAGQWGYIDRAGAIIIAPNFEEAWIFGDNHLAPVKVAGRWGYIDRAGTMVIQPQFDNAESFDRGGLATAKVGGLSGLIDDSGAWLIEPRYHKVWHNRNDVVRVELDGKIGVFERSGRPLASPQFSQIAVVCDDGWVVGYADREQRTARDPDRPLIMPQGRLSGIDCGEPFRIQDGSKFGYVDRMLRPITEVRFESAYLFSEHVAVVKLDGRFGYIRDDGSWLIEPRFDDAQPFHDGAAVVSVGGKFGYVRADGSWLVEPKFDEAEPFESGFAIAKLDGRRGVIDAAGAWVGTTRLRHLDLSLEKGLVTVRSDGKWGFMDSGGALVIEEKYDEVVPFSRGISWVKLDKSWCSIDRRGNSVPNLPCQDTAPTPTFALRPWPY
jgi:hypothetical protein